MSTKRLVVLKYLPDRLFGFVGDPDAPEASKVFFPVGNFKPGPRGTGPGCGNCDRVGCPVASASMPPVVGEPVDVDLPDDLAPNGAKAPRALDVRRVVPVQVKIGTVTMFDPGRGYGYILGDDGTNYHLHRCEVADGLLPMTGDRLAFMAGWRQGRPRACHARACRWRS